MIVATTYATDLNACINNCDATPSCVDVSFIAGNPGPCYLKYAANAPNLNANVYGARQISGCTNGTATPSFKRGLSGRVKLSRKRVVPNIPVLLAAREVAYGGPDYTWAAGAGALATNAAAVTSTVTSTV